MRKTVILIIACFLLCGCGETKKEATIQKIDCAKTQELVNDGAILVDVRSVFEYEHYHLDNAINIDVQVIENVIEEQIPDKKTKIIEYCQSGSRSNNAANILIEKGYTNVYDLGSIDNCEN